VLLTYGPVMLHEALTAAELLAERGVGLAVVDLPWLNRFDTDWLDSLAGDRLLVLEDHSPIGGLGDALRRAQAREVAVFGVEGWPACGTPSEALAAHGLDGATLAERVASQLASPV
jgi:transketolase